MPQPNQAPNQTPTRVAPQRDPQEKPERRMRPSRICPDQQGKTIRRLVPVFPE